MSSGQGAQIGIAILGGVIGGIVTGGNPAGIALGLSLGTIVGGFAQRAIDGGPDDILSEQEGVANISATLPRVGAPIPVVDGTHITAGNIVWAYPKVEFSHTEEIDSPDQGGLSGFGGGAPKQVTRFSTYQQIMWIAICRGPIKRVSRIWADQDLLYDESQPGDWAIVNGTADGQSGGDGQNTLLYARYVDAELEQFTLFKGTESQEAWNFAENLENVGVGTLPAYRGTAGVGVVFNLGSLGRVPNFRFEVVQADSEPGDPLVLAYAPDNEEVWAGWTAGVFSTNEGDARVIAYATHDAAVLRAEATMVLPKVVAPTTNQGGGSVTQLIVGESDDTAIEVNRLYTYQSGGRFAVLSQLGRVVIEGDIDARTAVEIANKEILTVGGMATKDNASGQPATTVAYTLPDKDAMGQFDTHTSPSGNHVRLAFTADSNPRKIVWNDNQQRLYVSLKDRDRVARVTGYGTPTLDEEITVGDAPDFLLVDSSNYVWCCNTAAGTLSRFQTTAGGVDTVTVGATPNHLTQADDGYIWCANLSATSVTRVLNTSPFTPTDHTLPAIPLKVAGTGSNGECWIISQVGRQVYRMDTSGTILNTINVSPGPRDIVVDDDGAAYVISGHDIIKISADGTQVISVDVENGLACVVRNISIEAGIPHEWIDVSGLDSTPVNMLRARVAPARSYLNELSIAYPFLGRETAVGMEYLYKGGSAFAAITDNAMSAAQNDPTEIGLSSNRKRQVDYPTRLTVVYGKPQRDYEDADQFVQRVRGPQEPESSRVVRLTPAFGEDQRIRDLAEIMLWEGYYARNPVTFSLPPTYSLLEPGDIVTVTYRGITETIRITRLTYGNRGDIEVEGVFHRSYLYEGFASIPSVALVSNPDLVEAGDVELEAIEVPPLLNGDTVLDVVAAVGLNDPLTGVVFPPTTVYKSTDNQATYNPVLFSALEATIGDIAVATPDKVFGWDRSTTITVILRSSDRTLSSASELAVLCGTNWAMVGNEVIGFATATLQSGSTYVLSNLLRGLQGTENETDGHVTNEIFVLLNNVATTLYKHDYTVALVGAQTYYKAVPDRSTLADATAVSHTPSGVSAQPWAPVILDPLFDTETNDYTLRWLHRSRLNGVWLNKQGITFDTDSQQKYRLIIYSDSTYTTAKRTVEVSATLGQNQTYAYTNAMQTTDFGAAQLVLFFAVHQLGQIVGKEARGQSPVEVELPYTETFYGSATGETAGISENFEA